MLIFSFLRITVMIDLLKFGNKYYFTLNNQQTKSLCHYTTSNLVERY